MPRSIPSRHSAIRIGIDTGGTFTDCVMVDGREVRITKVFSTPDDPARGIVEGVRALLESQRESRTPRRLVPSPRLEIIHGTTVGTNALLERKGARVALITTKGFEDLIELGRQNRPRLYDLNVDRQPPLVPLRLRFGVAERTGAEAAVLQAPSKSDLDALSTRLRKSGAESLALCFLFSYANPSNERTVARALSRLKLPLSVSHEILPEFREYERLSTVVVNAYLAPRLGAYLARLGQAFSPDSLIGTMPAPAKRRGKPPSTAAPAIRISIMQSNGGITTAERAAREPVRTILSGPAGGVVASARLAAALKLERVISFDMGGTSTDVSLIDGALRTTRETTLAGLPVAVPVLDVHSVGAGGGSLARFDAGGALRVGPESAGAVPGPICYGRGGDRPTVTDAHLILGRLDPEQFLGGSFRLDYGAAGQAFDRFLNEQARRFPPRLLPRTAIGLARGIVAVSNATMERALRVISVERGHDPRDFSLVCYGGAGGLHAADLARALDLKQVIVPPNPGAFSALGVLQSDVVRETSQSVLMLVPVIAEAEGRFQGNIEGRFSQLERGAGFELRMEGYTGPVKVARSLDMRYLGQSYELNVPFTPSFREAFHKEHERAYGHAQPERALEIVSLRVRLTIKTSSSKSFGTRQAKVRRQAPPTPVAIRPAGFESAVARTAFYDRKELAPGTAFNGPAVVFEYSATTVIPPDFMCAVDSMSNLILRRRD